MGNELQKLLSVGDWHYDNVANLLNKIVLGLKEKDPSADLPEFLEGVDWNLQAGPDKLNILTEYLFKADKETVGQYEDWNLEKLAELCSKLYNATLV